MASAEGQGIVSQRASGYARKAAEEYPSPPWVAEVVGRYLRSRGVSQIWEPAAGHPALVDALSACGFAVMATSDDFFEYTKPPHPGIGSLVTNPPYGIDRRGRLASDFIRHALTFEIPIVAMLLRIDFDSAKSRVDLFRDNKMFHGKLVLLDRVKWFEGPSSPSENHCWMIWDRDHKGPPTITYAERQL